jgi:TolB-like protein/Tfp pilus assembly protein PilF
VPSAAHDFRVADWLVEPRGCRISRRGRTAHVRPRLIDLLHFLASNPGRVVGKDEIFEHVWHGDFVVESVLARSIADLRRILDDRAAAPRVIETIAKRGYRLIAPVAWIATGDAVPRPSVAVLPFANLGPDPVEQYFCDGITEELTNALASVAGLRVTARTSAFAFRDLAVDVREVGRQLGVGHVVEGSVRRLDAAFRVTVQLIDASDGCHRWSRRFDRPSGDVFALQDEIAQAIRSDLEVTLLGNHGADVGPRRVPNREAHDLYLRGRYTFALRTAAALSGAARLFEDAIEKDPAYALAHAALAQTLIHRAFIGHLSPAEGFPKAMAAARRALDLDAGLAEGHAALGVALHTYAWDWNEAERELRRAIELAPSSADAHVGFANLLATIGRVDEALAEAERAERLDPLSQFVRVCVALRYSESRAFDQALRHLRTTLSMNPAFGTVHLHVGRVFWATGRFEEALSALQQAPRDLPLARGLLGAVLGRLGRHAEAREVIAELERLSGERYVGAVPFALIYQGLGDLDRALEWYTKAFDAREAILTVLVVDPVTEILRTDGRLRPLLERMHLPPPAPHGALSTRTPTTPPR